MLSALVAAALLAFQPSTCTFGGEAKEWTRVALNNWERLDRERIGMTNPSTPTLILFDQACTYRFTPNPAGAFQAGGRVYSVEGQPHEGFIDLPNGGQVPARKLSFAAPNDDGAMFFVMGLPALWRADKEEARNPDHLAMLVFMHEFAHTQQGEGLGRRIDSLIARGLPEDANDDTLQETWEDTVGYASSVTVERDLFYQSATAPSQSERLGLLAQAARHMTDRRNAFLTDQPLWREADDIFLTLEGSGNWAAWTWLTDPRGGGLTPEAATAFVRGKGRWWSQDQGLGLMLALDGLIPNWPHLTFGSEGTTADSLLERALQPLSSQADSAR